MDCTTCKKSIDEEKRDFFECDNCWAMNHLKCCGVKKTEVEARKTSKCLKLYCENCCVSPHRQMAEHIEMILKYVCKVDMVTQKQAENNKSVELMMQKIYNAQCDNNNNMKEVQEKLEKAKEQIDQCGAKLSADLLNVKQSQTELSGTGELSK